jgi:hypothetical protein
VLLDAEDAHGVRGVIAQQLVLAAQALQFRAVAHALARILRQTEREFALASGCGGATDRARAFPLGFGLVREGSYAFTACARFMSGAAVPSGWAEAEVIEVGSADLTRAR